MAEAIRAKLKSGEAKIERKADGKSDVWKRFGLVVMADDTTTDFAICLTCEALYKYDSHKTGTANLKRHCCPDDPKQRPPQRVPSDQPLISTYAAKKIKIPLAAKSKLVDDFVDFCCEDLRPFDVVSGTGFGKVAQGLINIGARYGAVNADDVLPHRQTICDRANHTAHKKRDVLCLCIQQALKYGIGITTDMWTDSFNMRSYTVLTCHYITEEWKLLSRVLSTVEFDSTLKKTAVNLHDQISKELLNLSITAEQLTKVVFVTDQGPNIKAALKNHSWLPCSAHVINIVLKHTFDERDAPDFMCEVTDQIHKCKSLVAYLKKSGSVLNLPYAVLQESETRWNSKAAMIDSVAKQHNEILELLKQKEQEHRIEGIQVEVLDTIGEFLSYFKDASDDLEGERYPTINSVVLWFHKLKAHCAPHSGDPEYMQYIRNRAGEVLKNKFVIKPTHKIAVFLSPRYKSLKMLPPDERMQVHAEVRRLTAALIPTLRAQAADISTQGELQSNT